MERSAWIAMTALVIGGAGIAWALWPAPERPASVQFAEDVSDDLTAKATLIRDPEGLVFNLSLDTHTVDLSAFDASRQVRLRAGAEELKPVRVEVLATDGHHLSVETEFARVEGPVSLAVLDVGSVPERRLVFP